MSTEKKQHGKIARQLQWLEKQPFRLQFPKKLELVFFFLITMAIKLPLCRISSIWMIKASA